MIEIWPSSGDRLRLATAVAAGALADALFFTLLRFCGADLGSAHCASMLAGSILIWALLKTLRGRAQETSAASWGEAGSFTIVTFLALFLRGGVLGLFANAWGWPTAVAMLPTLLAGVAIQYPGYALFALPVPHLPTDAASRWRPAVVALVAYLLALRLVYLGQLDLIPEEAYYWNYAQHPDIGYLDHPPMSAWLIAIGTLFFGHTEFGVRLGAFACQALATVWIFLLTKKLLGKSAAARAVLLIGALPFFFADGFLMTPDAPVVTCWAAALYFLQESFLRGRAAAWLGVGVSLGIGMLSKYPIALVGMAAVVFAVLDRQSRRWLVHPAPYGAAIVAALLFSPVILWNFQHEWASFSFQGPERWSQEPRFHLHMLVGSALLLITPLGLAGLCLGFRGQSQAEVSREESLGRRDRLYLLVATLVPLSVFVFSSLRNQTKVNWTGPVWLAGIPVMALSMVGAAEDGRRWVTALLERAWKPMLAALALFYGLALHYPVLGIPGLDLPRSYYTMNWRDLGRQVGEIEKEVLERTGEQPLTVGLEKYHLSSALAFYDPDGNGAQHTAAGDLLGKKGLMYSRWFPRELQKGKTMILVSSDMEDLTAPRTVACFARLDPVREIVVQRKGRPVARYHACVAYGYRPEAASSFEPVSVRRAGSPSG